MGRHPRTAPLPSHCGPSIVLAVAARRQVPVAYVPELVMCRAADLYPGEAKTDRRDAFVLADTARLRRHQVHWLDASNDELLVQLRVLNGYAADATRLSNRLRDALTGISPALERVLGPRLHHPGVRDLLARYPAPHALRKAGRNRIENGIRKRSPRLAKALTAAVMQALRAQTVVVPVESVMGRVVAEVVAELDRTLERRGNHRLKNAMILAAFASLRDPASRAYYDRKRAEGKKHNAAVICLARGRCDVILTMLRSRPPYRSRAPRHQVAAA